VALSVPGQAAASTPCWKKVLNDWSNGRAIGSYPLHCYRDAIRHLPEDLRDYSAAADDINAALQAQIAKRSTRSPQSLNNSSSNGNDHNNGSTGGTGNSGGGGSGPSATANAGPDRSAYRKAIDNLGTSNADSLPIPLIVLASVGALLLAAAAGLGTTKRIRAGRATRRGPPPAA
jgi:cobalamin biosynthesis Mg chelatase CobN